MREYIQAHISQQSVRRGIGEWVKLKANIEKAIGSLSSSFFRLIKVEKKRQKRRGFYPNWMAQTEQDLMEACHKEWFPFSLTDRRHRRFYIGPHISSVFSFKSVFAFAEYAHHDSFIQTEFAGGSIHFTGCIICIIMAVEKMSATFIYAICYLEQMTVVYSLYVIF